MSYFKKIMVFGTFDIFHSGHRYFLREAKKLGNYLIVIVARDKTVKKIKGKSPFYNEKERCQQIIKSRLADKVILGKLDNKYQVIADYQPDIIVLGYDQKFFINDLPNKLIQLGLSQTKIIRLPSYHPDKYKSSILRKKSNIKNLQFLTNLNF